MLEQLLKDLMPKAKIIVDRAGISEPVELLATEYIVIARTPTGEMVMGSGGPTFMNRAAIHMIKQALKAEEELLQESVVMEKKAGEGVQKSNCDCSKCKDESQVTSPPRIVSVMLRRQNS